MISFLLCNVDFTLLLERSKYNFLVYLIYLILNLVFLFHHMQGLFCEQLCLLVEYCHLLSLLNLPLHLNQLYQLSEQLLQFFLYLYLLPPPFPSVFQCLPPSAFYSPDPFFFPSLLVLCHKLFFILCMCFVIFLHPLL